ncbi:MAG: 50S ribosomal protein L24 [Pseudomonadota bacterium]
MAARIKKGDTVVVLAGRDKGRSGQVLQVLPKENRALVQGVNLVKKHQRAAPGKEAGIISKEAPIQISNIALRDPKDGKPTRVRFETKDGSKVRVAVRSGETIDG